MVYVPGEQPQTLERTGTLAGDPALPDFKLPLSRIFPVPASQTEANEDAP